MPRDVKPRSAARRPVLFGAFVGLLLMAAVYFGHAFIIVLKHEEPQRRRAIDAPRSRQARSSGKLEAVAAVTASLGMLEDGALDAAEQEAAESVDMAADEEAATAAAREREQAHAATQQRHAAEATKLAEVANLAEARRQAGVADPEAPAADAAEQSGTHAAAVAAAAGAAVAAACPPGRRPYHVVMTAATGTYQEWQSRIAYYHYLKQKRLNPCSDLGGFTRLFNTPNAQPDGTPIAARTID